MRFVSKLQVENGNEEWSAIHVLPLAKHHGVNVNTVDFHKLENTVHSHYLEVEGTL